MCLDGEDKIKTNQSYRVPTVQCSYCSPMSIPRNHPYKCAHETHEYGNFYYNTFITTFKQPQISISIYNMFYVPGQCGLVIEHQPMNEIIMVQFPVMAQAPVRSVQEAADQ